MADIKTINAVPVAGIKTYDNIPLADVKTINALTLGAAAGPIEPDDIPGLGAWWKADAGAGSIFAAQFTTANSEYLSIPHNPTLQLGDADWTVGGWFFLDAIASYQILLSKREAINPCELSIYLSSGTASVHAEVSPALTAIAPTPLTVGDWSFVVASYDSVSNTLGIQVNNGTIGMTAAATVPTTTAPFRLGSQVSAGGTEFYWGGRMQNVFVFGRLLNTADRTFLYNAGAGRTFEELDTAFRTNIRAWWPLEELSGSRRDVSGNDNTLTDNNTVTYSGGLLLNPADHNMYVYKWLDSGPNHLDLDAYIAAPTWVESALNGQPAVYFPGAMAARFVRHTAFAGSLLSGTNAGTIFVVLYQNGAYPNNALYGWLNPSPTNHIALYPTYGGYFDWDIGSAVPATGRIHVAAPAPWAGTWHLLELCRNGAAGEILYEGTVVTGGTFTDDLENTGSATFGLGWDNSGTFFNGYLGELLMYNRALSATERDTVREYLMEKWFAPPEPDGIASLRTWYRADQGVYSQSAAQLSAANQEYLSIPSNSTLQMSPTTDWTICGWVWWDVAPTVEVLVCKCITSASVDYQIYANGTALVVNATSYPSGATITIPGFNQWLFVVARYTAATNGFDISINNGAPVFGSLPADNPDTATGTFFLGAQPGGVSGMNARMQNWAMFGRYLNDTERTFLYNSGNGRRYEELTMAFKTGLRAWWPLDESGGSRRDLSGNNNTLTDNNTVTDGVGIVYNQAGDGARVASWHDSGPAGIILGQTTFALRPTYIANGVNGKPLVRLGGNKYMLAQGALSDTNLPVGPADGTWMGVVYVPPPADFNHLFQWLGGGSNYFSYILRYSADNNAYLDWGGLSPRLQGAVPAGYLSAWHLHEGYRNSSVPIGEIRIDGALIASQPLTAAITAGVSNLYFGCSVATTGFADADVPELVFYDVPLSAADRTILRNYFNTKYGLGL